MEVLWSPSSATAASSEEAAAGGAGEPAARPIFIIAPGASGGDCKELAEVLSRLGTVRGVAKWAGNFPGQMPANVALLRAKIEEALEARRGNGATANGGADGSGPGDGDHEDGAKALGDGAIALPPGTEAPLPIADPSDKRLVDDV